jgi:hypothetical protein
MSINIRASLLLILALAFAAPVGAQQAGPVQPSKAEAALSQAAQEGKYTFVLFYKANDPATSAMNTTIQQSLAKYKNAATLTFVYVADPAEAGLVAKYDVARAPMPMAVAIAPNGALTGLFPQKLEATHIDNSFVTPTMMQAMKALQENKIVFVTVQGSATPVTPAALAGFAADPHFNTRMVSLKMNASDPAEAKFLEEMGIDARTAATQLSLLAPPGILVGKFAATTPMNTIAAALAEAGKCCDDPNCKHHQAAPQQPAPAGAARPQAAPAAKR